MSRKKTVKCRWSHCCHDSQDIPRSEAVKEGNCYYHADCLKQKHLVQKIKDTWAKEIDPNFDNMQLTVAINNLAFKHDIELEYILYVVQKGAEGKWLNYPRGLYKAVNTDDKMYRDWKKNNAIRKVGNVQDKLKEVSPPTVEYVEFKKKPSGKARKRAEWERMFA